MVCDLTLDQAWNDHDGEADRMPVNVSVVVCTGNDDARDR